MLLAFVDEAGDRDDREYLGFSILTINAIAYPGVKEEVRTILDRIDWDPTVEFKGSYLFSQSKGCSDVQVALRVEAASRIIELNAAATNSRMRFHYGRLRSTTHGEDYLAHLPGLLKKALPRPPKGRGKNLLSVACDQRTDVTLDQLQAALAPAVADRGWVLFERIASVRSSCDTVGIMLADIVGYLASRIDNLGSDAELFEGLTPEQVEANGSLRKLRSSTKLIGQIRRFGYYSLVEG